MFIKRKEFETLKQEVSRLKNYAHNDYDRLNDHTKRIKKLEKEVEEPRSIEDFFFPRHLLGTWGETERQEPKKLTIRQQIYQIKEIHGITELVSRAERKLLLKPKQSKKPATRKVIKKKRTK